MSQFLCAIHLGHSSIPVECPSPLSAGELVLLLDRHLLPDPIALLPNLPVGFVWHPLVKLFRKKVAVKNQLPTNLDGI